MKNEELENLEEMAAPVSSDNIPTPPELQDIKAKLQQLVHSVKFRKIALIACAAIILLSVIIGISSHNSASAVAERYMEAYTFGDAAQLNQMSPYDYYSMLLYKYDVSESRFFEIMSRKFGEEIHNWEEFSKYAAKYAKEGLTEEYGKYTITVEAIDQKDMSLKDLENELSSELKKFESHAGFDRDDISKIKAITVKLKIKGEDTIENDKVIVYTVKIGSTWKVLSFSKAS